MTGAELAKFIAKKGFTEQRAADFFGTTRATVQRQKKMKKVPGPVAKCCELSRMLNHLLYHENKKIDDAIARGDCEPLIFNDSKRAAGLAVETKGIKSDKT